MKIPPHSIMLREKDTSSIYTKRGSQSLNFLFTVCNVVFKSNTLCSQAVFLISAILLLFLLIGKPIEKGHCLLVVDSLCQLVYTILANDIGVVLFPSDAVNFSWVV